MTDEQVKSFAKRVHRLLRDIERNGYEFYTDYDYEENPVEEYYPCCPSCGQQWDHREDCELAALIRESDAVIKGAK